MACFASGGDLGGGRYENGRICDGIFSSSLLSDWLILGLQRSRKLLVVENRVSE